MKKLLALILAALMVATLSACSEPEEEDGKDAYKDYIDNTVVKTQETIGDDTFYFEAVDSETVAITDFSSSNDAPHVVKIPAYVDKDENGAGGRRVVAVAKEAFCYKSNVTTVVFPTVEEYLAGNAELTADKITFEIRDYAFRDCAVFAKVTIPSYVTVLGKGAFYGCPKLAEVVFEEGCQIEEIKDSAFMDCKGLASIVIPASVKVIGQAAFFDCNALASVTLSEGVSIVSKQAFQNCDALAEIKLPTTLESVGRYAFHGSDALYLGGIVYEGDSEEVLEYIQSLLLEEAPVVTPDPEEGEGDETGAGEGSGEA